MDPELQEQFESAAKYMAGVSSKLSPDTLLYFYARYKQAKIGPCDTDKPGFFNFQGKQKWSAWKSLGDMTTETAMQEYIEKLDEIDPDWDDKEITEAKDSSWVSVRVLLVASSQKHHPKIDVWIQLIPLFYFNDF